ncbi:hypothetical protein PENFLA_c074G04571 [Penicillium flavigenum]|uniref:HAT C-terminal dimerisation domain-containing protein n=1 Tax=Penicillium flavigenum TaxID=254877 RepID=A0A1V6SBK5_9EURO|nr:hypothetical protein PENFLA_c074G04571 [Penicillium flavigenum]
MMNFVGDATVDDGVWKSDEKEYFSKTAPSGLLEPLPPSCCYREQYRESLERYIEPYKQRHLETQPASYSASSTEEFFIVDQMGDRQKAQDSEIDRDDQLAQYLGSSTRKINPCVFRKSSQYEFPVLASLARYVLSVPATGSGVERLFNTARDICHYRRGSLESKTIQDLMMYLCTSRFDIESEQHAFIEEYLTPRGIRLVKEKKKTKRPSDDVFNLIIDTEEDSSAETPPTNAPSRVALGKRPLRDIRDAPLIELGDENEDDETPLPDNSNIRNESDRGFSPPNASQIQGAAEQIIPRHDPSRTLGKNWAYRFIDRLPPRFRDNSAKLMEKERYQAVTPGYLASWYDRLEITIKTYEITERNLFNFDETGF